MNGVIMTERTKPAALTQAFQQKQAQQRGNPQQAENAFHSLLQKPNIQAMLIRLSDK